MQVNDSQVNTDNSLVYLPLHPPFFADSLAASLDPQNQEKIGWENDAPSRWSLHMHLL